MRCPTDLKAGLPLETAEQRPCDVVVEAPWAAWAGDPGLLATLVEAKKTLALDFGLRVCDDLFRPSAPWHTAGFDYTITINGVEVRAGPSMTPDDLARIILEVYSSPWQESGEAVVWAGGSDEPRFGAAATA